MCGVGPGLTEKPPHGVQGPPTPASQGCQGTLPRTSDFPAQGAVIVSTHHISGAVNLPGALRASSFRPGPRASAPLSPGVATGQHHRSAAAPWLRAGAASGQATARTPATAYYSADPGGSPRRIDNGLDVVGAINGEPAQGEGRILTGCAGNRTTDGLAVRFTGKLPLSEDGGLVAESLERLGMSLTLEDMSDWHQIGRPSAWNSCAVLPRREPLRRKGIWCGSDRRPPAPRRS